MLMLKLMPPPLLLRLRLRLHLRLPLHCDDDDFENVGSAWLGWHGWGGPVADPRDDDGTHQNTKTPLTPPLGALSHHSGSHREDCQHPLHQAHPLNTSHSIHPSAPAAGAHTAPTRPIVVK